MSPRALLSVVLCLSPSPVGHPQPSRGLVAQPCTADSPCQPGELPLAGCSLALVLPTASNAVVSFSLGSAAPSSAR